MGKGKAFWQAIIAEWKAATLGEKVIALVSLIATLSLFSYIFWMVVWPLFSSGFDWAYVQRVWHSWQALNVGMIALGSSLLAFYSAYYNSRQKRKYEHLAAVAFLPRALSELTSYFEESAKLLTEAYEAQSRTPLNTSVPSLPLGYEEVFYRCIIGAHSDLARYLASMLSKLQIHHSRAVELSSFFSSASAGIRTKQGIAFQMVFLAELHAMTGNLFEYARFWSKSYRHSLTKSDYLNSCAFLKIYPAKVRELSIVIDSRVRDYDPMELT